MNVYRSLTSDGAFLMDMMGKEVLARIFQERGWREEDGLIILEEREVTKNWGWIENRWILLKGGQKQEVRLSHRIYSAVELTSLLSECGFDRVNVHGDAKGTPYDHTAKRLVIVARKSESK